MKSAYPNLNQPVTITLYANVPFDNKYTDHSFISDRFLKISVPLGIATKISQYAKQENFLNRKNVSGNYVYPRWTLTDTFNFDFKNGLVGTLYLELTPEQTNSNFLKVTCGDDEYYYFITSITQQNYGTFLLNLELDVIMTYGDELLDGLEYRDVFTKRKHCKRYSKNSFAFSPDYKNGDTAFSGNKPNIIERVDNCSLSVDYENTTIFNDILWLYATCDIYGTDNDYNIRGVKTDVVVVCYPINKNITLRLNYGTADNPSWKSYQFYMLDPIDKFIEKGHFKSARISPYPPFNKLPDDFSVYESGGIVYIEGMADEPFIEITQSGSDIHGTFRTNDYWLRFGNDREHDSDLKGTLSNSFIIHEQNNCEYSYDEIFAYDFTQDDEPITAVRVKDPKLMFRPFKKYCITSASGEEQEFYPELLCSLSPFRNNDNQALYLKTITSAYSGDYTTFTYISPITLSNSVVGYANYKITKTGLATTMNYTYPVGTNALEVFKSTQSETYYQSKIASGITSGLTMIGGAVMTAGGIVISAGSGGTFSPMGFGMISGGMSALSGGTASLANTIKSTTAKIEDLKNTPDSINVSGSSFAHDVAMSINNLKPVIVTYNSAPVVIQSADDLFYTKGYEVARECEFNLMVYNANTQDGIDITLFNRTIFNYIELQDDITNKIRSNIPLVVKQKLSSIFNNGITLWTFFGFRSLYPSTSVIPNEPSSYDLDLWLFKNRLENKEYKGEYYGY